MTPKRFSQGIEKVLALAALDEKFRENLFSDRAAALDECGLELTDSERSILMSIPEEQLQSAIKSTKVPEYARRAFLKGASAAVVAALAITTFGAGVLLSSCTDRISGNESAVIANLRTLSSTQEQYRARYGTYATLKQLADADLIDEELGSGKKHGYTFVMEATMNIWNLTAIPDDFKESGVRGFSVDHTGVLRFTTDGSPPRPSPMSASLGHSSDR
ncbi:MAG: hypothetical protein E3J72_09725 [Planctomycetota bacterium]|nr:MAG: hypothetical protein E3J72_09725 [Planctomycetota bacterium]